MRFVKWFAANRKIQVVLTALYTIFVGVATYAPSDGGLWPAAFRVTTLAIMFWCIYQEGVWRGERGAVASLVSKDVRVVDADGEVICVARFKEVPAEAVADYAAD